MRKSVLVALIVVLAGCSHPPEHDSLLSRVREAESRSSNGGLDLSANFDGDTLVPVRVDGADFHIRSRESALQKFPCQQCHKVPLVQMKHDGKDGKPRAHWGVQLKHASDSVMACSTCHSSDDLNQLRTLTNKPVAMNSSWQVCAQCHSKQAHDWAGGAHGKRVAGWAPPRVSRTCVECHNPHQPAWDKRIPVHVALTGVATAGKERN